MEVEAPVSKPTPAGILELALLALGAVAAALTLAPQPPPGGPGRLAAAALILAALHEAVHYATFRAAGVEVRVARLPWVLGVVILPGQVGPRLYIASALAPLAVINLPLTLYWLVAGSRTALFLDAILLVASAGDVAATWSIGKDCRKGGLLAGVVDASGRPVGVLSVCPGDTSLQPVGGFTAEKVRVRLSGRGRLALLVSAT